MEEVGDIVYYLFSNLFWGVIGEVIYVDSGYYIIGF